MILHRVTLFSAGLYSCEVSADFPDYDTEIRRQHMHVFGENKSMKYIRVLPKLES